MSLFSALDDLQQEALKGGAVETVYIRYNDGFKGGDGYFNNQDNGLVNSFEKAGEDVTTSKTKNNYPDSVEVNGSSYSKDYYEEVNRLGSESTVMQVKVRTDGTIIGKY